MSNTSRRTASGGLGNDVPKVRKDSGDLGKQGVDVQQLGEAYKEIKWVDINEIKPHPKNPNKHTKEQIERLAKNIKELGFRNPLIVSRSSGYLIAGHGRLEAAKKLSLKKIPIIEQEFKRHEDEYAHLVADNALASWAELDLSQINTDILDLGPDFDIELLGIKGFEIEPADKYGDKDADATPELRATSVVSGDIYSLGNHRLMCGDSTDAAQVERLMNSEKADMVFTDPPYGMGAVENSGVLSKKYRPIEGDASPELAKTVFKLFGTTPGVWWGANYFCSVLPDAAKWLVWDKNNGGSDQTDCELAWTNLPGVVRQFTLASEKTNRVHPTQKPVALIEWAFGFCEATNVFDPFLGSGSTLIACEKTNRKCYGMEIDPQYCQVIIDRWEKFTGQKAVKL